MRRLSSVRSLGWLRVLLDLPLLRPSLTALLFVVSFHAFAEPSPEYKQLAGPPEEMAAMAAPDPARSRIVSKSALLPVVLENQGDHWISQTVIPAEGDVLRLIVFSRDDAGSSPWRLSVDRPQGAAGDVRSSIEAPSLKTFGMSSRDFPAELYEIATTPKTTRVVTLTSDQPGRGFILLEGAGPIRLSSHLAARNQRVGQKIEIVASVIDTTGKLATNADSSTAYLRLTEPDGHVVTLPMDPSPSDSRVPRSHRAGFIAERPGNYIAQVVMQGHLPDGEAFIRTTEHLIPVVPESVRLLGSATTRTAGDHRLNIALPVASSEGVRHYRVIGEVWGSGASGEPVAVAWIGGLSNVVDGALELGLDTRWIAKAGARPPFEVRNVRVEDPDHFIIVTQAARVPFEVPREAIGAAVFRDIQPDEEMLMGPRPRSLTAAGIGSPSSQAYTDGVGHKLLLVHGYCSSDVWGPVSSQFTNAAVFLDLDANRTHDAFAQRIKSWALTWNSYAIVAHSQGGAASLQLYAYYWSGLDNAGSGRLIQSVGTPYQGTNLAGILAKIGSWFGKSCGSNYDLTYDGAAAWLAGIPSSYRAAVNYFTTSFTDNLGYDYCHALSDVVLTDPDDGVTEQLWGQLPGGVNQGHKTGWCHSAGMRDPAQTTDSARNSSMNANAAKGPPTVTTNAASGVGQTTATLNGTVNPSGASTTTAFEYGTTTSYGSSIASQTRTGFSAQSISATPTLQCSTTYHFRAKGTNSVGTRYGNDAVFTTSSCPPTPPAVTTLSPTNVGQTSATLNGNVNPNGSSTTTAFDYGTTTSYGSVASAQTRTGSSVQAIYADVTTLQCSTLYYYRARGTNSGGTSYGSAVSFTTQACPPQPPPTVNTGAATGVGATTATLNGTVNPNGASTATGFQYGTASGSYPFSIDSQTRTGTTTQSISAGVNGLQCGGTTYYYRARGTNAGGTSYGAEQIFQTAQCPVTSCVYTITSASGTGSGSGGSGTVQVASTTGSCDGTWSALSNNSWLTLTGTSSGSGAGTWQVPYSYAANPSTTAQRIGSISFSGSFSGGNTFNLTQAPAPSEVTCTPLYVGSPILLPSSSAPRFEFASYCMDVPTGVSRVTFTLSGGTGDPDLYVRYGQPPTSSLYDCRPYVDGTEETCAFDAPQAGKWYVGIDTFAPYSGVTLSASFGTSSTGTSLYVVTPCRIVDTRNPSSGPALASGSTRELQITGLCGIPSTARAIVANITAVAPVTTGFLAFYPAGATWPGNSTINYRTNKTRANNAILMLSTSGRVTVLNNGSAQHFIVDVTGYFQ